MTDKDAHTGAMASVCRRCRAGLVAVVGSDRESLRRALVLAALLGFAVNAVVWLAAAGFMEQQEARNALLKERIAELDQRYLRVLDVRERTNALLAQAAAVSALLAGSDQRLRDLQAVSSVVRDLNVTGSHAAAGVPTGVRLTDLELSSKGLLVKGDADAPAGISELLRRLQALGYGDVRLSSLAYGDQLQSGGGSRRSFVVESGPKVDRPEHAQSAAAVAATLPMPPAATDGDDSYPAFVVILGAGGLLIFLVWFVRTLGKFGLRRPHSTIAASADRRHGGRRCLAAVDASLLHLRSIDPANPDGWPSALRLLVVLEIFLLVALTVFSLAVSDVLDELDVARREESSLREDYVRKQTSFGAVVEKFMAERFASVERDFGGDAARIPEAPDDVRLLADIERIAGGRKVALLRLQKEGSERLQISHVTQAWSLHASGSFSALGGMLEDIGRGEFLVSLASLRMRPLASATGGLLLEAVLETHRRSSQAEIASLKTSKKGKK